MAVTKTIDSLKEEKKWWRVLIINIKQILKDRDPPREAYKE